MKTLRMITCFLITCTFVFLLLTPGKAQASDYRWDGIWAVEVIAGTMDDWYDKTYLGTWIVGFKEGNSVAGACTWIGCPNFVDSLSGTVDGESIEIVRTIIQGDTVWEQTYEGDLYPDYIGNKWMVEGEWTGVGCPIEECHWRATICRDRLEIPSIPPNLEDKYLRCDQ